MHIEKALLMRLYFLTLLVILCGCNSYSVIITFDILESDAYSEVSLCGDYHIFTEETTRKNLNQVLKLSTILCKKSKDKYQYIVYREKPCTGVCSDYSPMSNIDYLRCYEKEANLEQSSISIENVEMRATGLAFRILLNNDIESILSTGIGFVIGESYINPKEFSIADMKIDYNIMKCNIVNFLSRIKDKLILSFFLMHLKEVERQWKFLETLLIVNCQYTFRTKIIDIAEEFSKAQSISLYHAPSMAYSICKGYGIFQMFPYLENIILSPTVGQVCTVESMKERFNQLQSNIYTTLFDLNLIANILLDMNKPCKKLIIVGAKHALFARDFLIKFCNYKVKHSYGNSNCYPNMIDENLFEQI